MQDKIEILEQLTQLWLNQQGAVSSALDAHQLASTLDVSLSQQGASDQVIKRALHDYIAYTPNSARPEFFKLLYSGLNQTALLGDWVASLTNATMHTYQVAPVATLMELELIEQCNRLIGFKQGDGVMVGGGSQANLVGMMLARHRACPKFKQQGLAALNGQVLRAYVSDQAHYSYQRAANTLGIGSDNLISVESDQDGRLCPSKLAAAIEADLANGYRPFFIGATAGTTVVGAFDPIRDCHALAHQHGVWLHVDGAWGAPVLFSDKHRHLMEGCDLADSLAWDAHKLMNVPITAALILVQQKGQLEDCTAGGGGDYLFHSDVNADYNLGERSLQCGRRADALKVWLTWKSLGHAGLAAKVDKLQQLKSATVDAITAHPALQIIGPTSFLNLLFRFVPDSDISQTELNQLNQTICREMVKGGGPYVDYATYKGQTGVRLILANQDLCWSHVEHLLDRCAAIGKEFAGA